eukprot:scaffold4570_cov81-Cylindrotheca_fusiformis.AAC.1
MWVDGNSLAMEGKQRNPTRSEWEENFEIGNQQIQRVDLGWKAPKVETRAGSVSTVNNRWAWGRHPKAEGNPRDVNGQKIGDEMRHTKVAGVAKSLSATMIAGTLVDWARQHKSGRRTHGRGWQQVESPIISRGALDGEDYYPKGQEPIKAMAVENCRIK